jgi:hypothetical protein
MLQNQGEEEIGHQGIFFIFFLRNQQETKLSKGYNRINEAKLWYQMMRTS